MSCITFFFLFSIFSFFEEKDKACLVVNSFLPANKPLVNPFEKRLSRAASFENFSTFFFTNSHHFPSFSSVPKAFSVLPFCRIDIGVNTHCSIPEKIHSNRRRNEIEQLQQYVGRRRRTTYKRARISETYFQSINQGMYECRDHGERIFLIFHSNQFA